MTNAGRQVKRSRQRGRKVERELAALVNGYCGDSKPDVITEDTIFEAKSHKRKPPKNLAGPLGQAETETRGHRRAVAVHKYEGPYWLAMLKLEDLQPLLRAEREMATLAVQCARLERTIDAYERAYGGLPT